MFKICSSEPSISSPRLLLAGLAIFSNILIALVFSLSASAGEPGAHPNPAPYGPGYAGYGKPNYYVGSRPSPPDYSYPLQIAPFAHSYRGPIPWSEAWYDYCLSRYLRFDPRTGYVSDAAGGRMFCR
ncbi:BA14K family protein [Breoghania sp.]|uniref:BA14K family protein n=1 Tax=Breoghania sp. TaxID=2065378 RepID=UPI002AA8291A|nr:BA14K family protein [Breoghania sp.]